MTQKALNFVVSGMLSNEREIAEERIAFILSILPEHMLDGFTDGFVIDAAVTVPENLLNFVKERNRGKVLTSLVKTSFIPVSDGEPALLQVECSRTVYVKDGGKEWDTRDAKDDDYCVEIVKTWTERIPLTGAGIPGVEVQTL